MGMRRERGRGRGLRAPGSPGFWVGRVLGAPGFWSSGTQVSELQGFRGCAARGGVLRGALSNISAISS